jgi:nitroimidazol reductase NimA-like FMN-containing flavoprotein (pyridoxamine 5'-phosphate oxidase superfamily)
MKMTPEHRHPRRRDRSQDEDWIKSLLHRGEAAVMAATLDGAPFCLPRIYAFDENRAALYVHGAFGGAMGKALSQGNGTAGMQVALTVYEMGRLLPADEALEFGVEYASVIVSGRAVEVDEAEEALHGLMLLMRKYAPHLRPGHDYRPIAHEELTRTSVIRIDIETWSGKQKAEAPDFPGAYRLSDVR